MAATRTMKLAYPTRLASRGAADDRTIAYALAAEPVFVGLKDLIGQLSGILILLETARRKERNLPDVALARERWREIVDRLGRLNVPESRRPDLDGLRQAAAHTENALAALNEMRRAKTAETVDTASHHLKAAYRSLQSACDHRIGLAMVDTSNACCSCGMKLA